MGECDCRDDCCLEVVPVTVEEYTIDGAGLTLAVANVSPTEANVTIDVDESDYFDIKCWLQDAATPTASPSPVPPSTPGVSEFNVVTDVNGDATVNIQHTGTSRSWYLCATLGNGVVISDAITVGV